MNQRIQSIVKLLESSQYADRMRGSDQLLSLELREEILAFHEFTEANDNYGLRLSFQKLLFRLLKSDREETSGLAMSILLGHASLPEKGIKKEAEKLIDEYLGTPHMFQYLKFLTMKKAWKLIGPEERIIATKKIGNFQMVEVLSLLIDNFLSPDPKLVILTMEVFRRLGDKRANRFIREILEKEAREEVIIKALNALSYLGFVLDRKYFLQFMTSDSEDIRLASLEGLYNLNKEKVIPEIKSFFLGAQTVKSKEKVVEILTRVPTKKSIRALLELWQEEEFSPVEHKIEWALNEIEGPEKLDAILEFFEAATEVVELKLIALLNEIHHPRCYEFYLKLIRENKNSFLTMSAMEAVAYYNDEKTLPYLEPHLKDPEEMLHYYALAAYVKHSTVDLTKVLEDTISFKLPDDRHHHQLLLNVLHEQLSIKSLSLYIQTYVLQMISSPQRDNRYLAYAIIGRFHQEFELPGIFAQFNQEKNDLVIREGHIVFAEIFSYSPFTFLAANPPESLFTSETFIARVRLEINVLMVLFERGMKQFIYKLQAREPVKFWKLTLKLFEMSMISTERIHWIDLTSIPFEDFTSMWGLFKDEPEVRTYLLQSVSTQKDPNFGEFLISEYFNRGSEDLYPYVSRYVNGLS